MLAYLLFLLFRENPILAHEIIVHDRQSLRQSNFDSNRLTKIFVHGKDQRSNEERLDPETVYMRDAYLRFADVNFILVDWTSMSKGFRYFTNYGDIVSHRIVEFLKFLNRHGHTPLGSLHMIGLSWGAHVIGKAGHMLGSKIGRLTGKQVITLVVFNYHTFKMTKMSVHVYPPPTPL